MSLECRRIIVGRSIFSTDFEMGPLGDGVDYYRGFYQSLRPTQMGLSLNIGVYMIEFYVYVYEFVYVNVCLCVKFRLCLCRHVSQGFLSCHAGI